jgi:DNA primase
MTRRSAPYISSELIEAVRASNPIEHLAGEHTQLRRSGVELLGRCPFHADGTSSLYIRPAKQAFHCFGCQAGGDVFEFVRLLHHCSFRQSVEILATRAGIKIDGFTPSPELIAKVSALRTQREEETQFQLFCNARIEGINRQYRILGRAASHAEECLRTGTLTPYEQEMAWDALERFRIFEGQVEREGLCDLDILKSEWSKLRDAA